MRIPSIAEIARSADSRPEPGPLTKTSTLFIPLSTAFFRASSAATLAAKGVLFLEPLNPCTPVLDHEDWQSVKINKPKR